MGESKHTPSGTRMSDELVRYLGVEAASGGLGPLEARDAMNELIRARAEEVRLSAEIASKDRLLPSLLAEGKALEQARAERAEATKALMLEALRDGDGDTFAGTLEGIANLLVISGLDREHAATVDFLRRKASKLRAAIKAATGGET